MQAPLLELKGIGKIYVSDSNVSVGIRGVNLAFNAGEFVAVTGKSGSGKSTLLNVISGMDTYEEGELLVEGEPTSHYMQKDWEEYRKQYISFIFQDYNIIESFTVLQNVELALMNMENPRERRARALELIRRVGLEKHVNHKGSRLSGGQKQRTVIARALAKDSPIILADEPTGNLDSQSSKEIIELLREVSADKLVIVVTHNFEEVEAHATRHIRVYDGAVEVDHNVRPAAPVPAAAVSSAPPPTAARKAAHHVRNGFLLGRVRFTAMPKLTVFLCLLMTVTSLVVFFMTSLTYDSRDLFKDKTMFTHVDGRLVIVRRDGGIITDEELAALSEEVGATDFLHYDSMLDESIRLTIGADYDRYQFSFGYPAEDVRLDAGRYPAANDEVILEVPVSFKTYLGTEGFEETRLPLLFNMASYTVVGVRYYYDNTRTPRMLFTEEGYQIASALAFYSEQKSNFSYNISLTHPEVEDYRYGLSMGGDTYVDFGLPEGTYFVNHSQMAEYVRSLCKMQGKPIDRDEVVISTVMSGSFNRYQYEIFDEGLWSNGKAMDIGGIGYGGGETVQYPLDKYSVVWDISEALKGDLESAFYEKWSDTVGIASSHFVVVSPDVLLDFMYEQYYTKAYTQASLFFDSDRDARSRVETLRDMGYTAVASGETVEPDVLELLERNISAGMNAFLWLITIGFSTIFLHLCSSRAMNATKGDVAIMRSMGIPTVVVRISIYVQTLISLIPAVIVTTITAIVIYTVPTTNYKFPFLHAGDYAILAVVLLAIAINLSRKYVKRMFGESVKKTLRFAKGGAKE